MIGSATNHLLKAILLLFLPAISTAAAAQTAGLDITPLFAGYEAGCQVAPGAGLDLIYWARPNERGIMASTDSLPAVWQGHIGTPRVEDRHDHWYVKVPLPETRFHGLKVLRLERWIGKGCGISGWSLVLDAPIGEVRRHIDEKKFQLDENLNFKPELVSDPATRTTRVVCDVSM